MLLTVCHWRIISILHQYRWRKSTLTILATWCLKSASTQMFAVQPAQNNSRETSKLQMNDGFPLQRASNFCFMKKRIKLRQNKMSEIRFSVNENTMYSRPIVILYWNLSCSALRRSWDHLIVKMGNHILVRRHLYTETAPWSPKVFKFPFRDFGATKIGYSSCG